MGLLLCSEQATSQHLQPMHFVMSKWKRYCSPSFSGTWEISDDLPTNPRSCRDGVEGAAIGNTTEGLSMTGGDVKDIATFSRLLLEYFFGDRHHDDKPSERHG